MPDKSRTMSAQSMSVENISSITKMEEKTEKNIEEKIASVQSEMYLKFEEMEKKYMNEIDNVFKTFSAQMSETHQNQMEVAMNKQIETQQSMNTQLL